ncbi:MAG: DNA mismatch repair endonuclease MutL [Lachnospiraceae bacterium]|nr:DNA mismatch repair endonuclease MutL [Lachnospiraceae bacterium]
MGKIELLSQDTIDKIAAGEVIERPSSVVKELVENAIDAGATAITVEIKEGGTSFIRITDNGSGIAKEDISLAFLRHSTSKIKSAEDLMCVNSLGFRGEALSSIAAVARVELITKTRESLTGTRYLIEGSKEISKEEIGAPDGTTFLVRDLFFNTPARRKFLKTAQTEGTYISDMVEKLALSHPDISFQYINNNQTRLHSSGNGSRKDLVYHIYGRDITAALLEINYQGTWFSVTGFLGKPQINRGNRNYENYFINGRYIKSTLLSKAIEEGYKSFLMQHQYPFTVLYFSFPSETLDVNVHPTKMELRFDHNKEVYQELVEAVYGVLSHRELIPEVPIDEKKEKKLPPVYKESIPEPFEKRRINQLRSLANTDSGSRGLEYKTVNQQLSKETGNHSNCYTDTKEGEQYHPVMNTAQKAAESVSVYDSRHDSSKESVAGKVAPEKNIVHTISPQPAHHSRKEVSEDSSADKQEGQYAPVSGNPDNNAATEQLTLASMSPDFLTEDARKKHRIIGQLFATYWLVEYEDKLYIMDQHAAHEKVLYERTMARLKEKEYTSQTISPPIVLSLNAKEEHALQTYLPQIEALGYEVENFGGREYMISAVPDNLFHIDMKDLFIEMLDDFSAMNGRQAPELILEKVASMSCKAAVKGNHELSLPEVDALISELLTLENPFNCPHGRPTIISMSKSEIEKKFKRIVS